MPQWGMVCLSLGGCAPVWEGVPPVWEGVHQCERVFPSVEGNDLSHLGTPFHTGAHPPTLGHSTIQWELIQTNVVRSMP